MDQPEGSCITHLSWGRVEVRIGSQRLQFRDCKIWPTGAEEWDWNTSGTRHQPGIRLAAVEEILERGARVVVLGCGFHGSLGVCPGVGKGGKEQPAPNKGGGPGGFACDKHVRQFWGSTAVGP